VRLGGIYALQRIAQDSPRDQPTVVDVLCTFVRRRTRRSNDDLEALETPIDVQAAVTVISGLRRHGDELDLSETHLKGASAAVVREATNSSHREPHIVGPVSGGHRNGLVERF
jgi:hypothetical protein